MNHTKALLQNIKQKKQTLLFGSGWFCFWNLGNIYEDNKEV